ncbi:MAG: alanine racemase [Phycisphaeraceae bacterium]|nr:alanine racemase [Phycisphaeraceae bacterium]
MADTSLIEVNLSSVEHNFAVMRDMVGEGCLLCPVVKADAYGLGAARLAKRMAAAGADMFAVFSPEQAAALSATAVGKPVLVLMPVRDCSRSDELYRMLVSGSLHLTVHDLHHLDQLRRIAEKFAAVVPVHLEVDTGMSRGGCSPDEAALVLKRIAACRWLRLAGVFTHFSNPRCDPLRTRAQMDAFDALLAAHSASIPSECIVHVASSYAALRHRRYHRSMVRFGLAWTGLALDGIESGEVLWESEQLRPIVTWRSQVSQIKVVPAGAPVGYGSLWRADRTSRIGLIPVGYADGYPICREARDPRAVRVRALGLRGAIEGWAPVVGAVNMDQVAVDLTEIDGLAELPEGGVGAEVELISPDRDAPNHLPRVAAAAGLIPYEFLCRLGPRIRRQYIADTVPASSVSAVSAVPAPRAAVQRSP